jgi:subtilisin family serine protease
VARRAFHADRTGSDGYDSGDYALTFNGTSSATPHVAGVAAPILQANPNLTQKQVVAIIEKCARKVGPYAYQATSGRPNSPWHQEMGYGLVDAKACVRAATADLSASK